MVVLNCSSVLQETLLFFLLFLLLLLFCLNVENNKWRNKLNSFNFSSATTYIIFSITVYLVLLPAYTSSLKPRTCHTLSITSLSDTSPFPSGLPTIFIKDFLCNFSQSETCKSIRFVTAKEHEISPNQSYLLLYFCDTVLWGFSEFWTLQQPCRYTDSQVQTSCLFMGQRNIISP